MNRLAMIAATGFLALLLTGCGDDSKPADAKQEAVAPQTQDNNAAAPNANDAVKANDAEGKSGDAQQSTDDQSH